MCESKKCRVFIADDHPLFRVGLRLSLNQEKNIEVIGEAEDGYSAVEKILADHPDIALIDVDMPGLSGIGAIRILRKAIPEMKMLVLSTYDDDHYVTESMEAGADGYVLKNIDAHALAKVIESICNGETAISPYLLNLAMNDDAKDTTELKRLKPGLTIREKEVLRFLAEAKGNKAIADMLYISPETVKTHMKNIFKKLNVINRAEAVKVAVDQDLLNR